MLADFNYFILSTTIFSSLWKQKELLLPCYESLRCISPKTLKVFITMKCHWFLRRLRSFEQIFHQNNPWDTPDFIRWFLCDLFIKHIPHSNTEIKILHAALFNMISPNGPQKCSLFQFWIFISWTSCPVFSVKICIAVLYEPMMLFVIAVQGKL